MYGILAEREGRFVMHNKIFEILIYDHLIAQRDVHKMASKFTQVVDKGYLLQFNFNKNKKYTKEWINFNDKKLFEVVV